MLTHAQKLAILDCIQPFDPSMVGIFGSYARNEQTANSDLDILVDFKKTVNLLDLVGIEQDLSMKLNIKVDLITLKSVHENLKPYIQKDLISIL